MSLVTVQSEILQEPVDQIHHTCHDPSCKDPNHWRLVHATCNNQEAGRQGQRKNRLPRSRLGRRHYRDTKVLLFREQQGLCHICHQPGTLKRGNVDSGKNEKERENLPGANLHDPLIAEIEIHTTLRPWFWDWLIDHTDSPNKVLTYNQAVHVSSREAFETFGYGANQTIRGYLKDWTLPDANGLSPFRVDRSDTAIGKRIVRGKWPSGWKEAPR